MNLKRNRGEQFVGKWYKSGRTIPQFITYDITQSIKARPAMTGTPDREQYIVSGKIKTSSLFPYGKGDIIELQDGWRCEIQAVELIYNKNKAGLGKAKFIETGYILSLEEQ